MSEVVSLICWGGLTGKSVIGATATDIITSTNHGLRTGTALVAQSTVSGVVSGTTYYASYIDQNTFYLYDTLVNAQAAGATGRIDITATTAFYLKSKVMLDYMTAYPTRWGAVSSERIYNGLAAWLTARSGALATDDEVCELGEAFTERATSTRNIALQSRTTTITSLVDGVRSAAFHAGVVGDGFILELAYNTSSIFVTLGTYRKTIDGFTIRHGAESTASYGACVYAYGSSVINNMIVKANSLADGLYLYGAFISVNNNLILNCLHGIKQQQYNIGSIIGRNTVSNCVTGIGGSSTTNITCQAYGNVCLGNTTNWQSVTGIEVATNNAGGTGEAWMVGTGSTRIEITEASPFTATFVDWTNNDFRPTVDAVSGAGFDSQLIDAGIEYYGILPYDIAGGEVPNYNNGGAEAVDVGAYEYDHGYGDRPQQQPVAITGIASGTRIKIAKQSDGTELYNDIPGTSISYDEDMSTDTAVYVYARKGSAATYYHPLKLSATIDSESGLSLSLSGLQNEDIAAHDYSATAVATDWTFNSGTGAITHASGTTRYSVQDLYSWHQDYYDDSATVDDNPLMHGTTSTIYELINGGTITDGDLEDLYGGSIEFENGDLWSNLWTTNTMAAAHSIYVVQSGAKYTAFWSAGPIDVLLQVSDAGTLRSSGLVDVYARPWGYTYAYYQADLSVGGRTVAPIATLADANITETDTTVGGWTDVAVTFSTYSLDFGDGDGNRTYYCRIDCNSRPLSEVYQRMQYLTRDVSTATLNGVAGWQYQSAHTGYDANVLAPFGTYSGGVWSLAKGVWLDNVPSGDLTNYIVTDDTGDTHQNTVALNQSVTISGVTAGSRVQIYDTTNSTELFNSTTGPYAWEDPLAPVGDRAIRVRISYVSGASAKEFIEANIGTCGTSASTKDVSYLAAQSDDTVYNANAIDGSTVTGITFTDSATDVMNINLSGGEVTLGSMFSAWVYYANTEAGIRTDIDYMRAIDTANYVYSGMVWKNTSSPPVPLKISGGYAWDSVTEDPIDLVDTTGGTIFLAPPHVVSKTVTVSGVNVITGDIADVPTSTEITAAIFAQAGVTPIHADARAIKGKPLGGEGVPGDEFHV